jgi:hypothetical protein
LFPDKEEEERGEEVGGRDGFANDVHQIRAFPVWVRLDARVAQSAVARDTSPVLANTVDLRVLLAAQMHLESNVARIANVGIAR